MTFAEDAAHVLGKPPREDTASAPEPARREALVVLKRAEAALAKDPRAGLAACVEALDLDPGCKAAYEAIGKAVLARADGDRAAIEAAIRFVAVGTKRSPQDAQLRELEKRLRATLPVLTAEPALTTKPTRPSEPRPMAGHGPGRVCKFCNSPIPVGAPDCRSCSMSGELPKPAGVVDHSREGTSPAVVVGALVLLVALGAGVVYVVTRPKPATVETKKP